MGFTRLTIERGSKMEILFDGDVEGKLWFHYFHNKKGAKVTACVLKDSAGNFTYGQVTRFYADGDNKILARNQALKKALSKFSRNDQKSVVLSMIAQSDFNFI